MEIDILYFESIQNKLSKVKNKTISKGLFKHAARENSILEHRI